MALNERIVFRSDEAKFCLKWLTCDLRRNKDRSDSEGGLWEDKVTLLDNRSLSKGVLYLFKGLVRYMLMFDRTLSLKVVKWCPNISTASYYIRRSASFHCLLPRCPLRRCFLSPSRSETVCAATSAERVFSAAHFSTLALALRICGS